MVFDGAVVVSTVASLLLNGLCCAWQMQEEDERCNQLRKKVRVEYELQRLYDRENWEQRMDRVSHREYSSAGMERRRLLMITKKNATNSPSRSKKMVSLRTSDKNNSLTMAIQDSHIRSVAPSTPPSLFNDNETEMVEELDAISPNNPHHVKVCHLDCEDEKSMVEVQLD